MGPPRPTDTRRHVVVSTSRHWVRRACVISRADGGRSVGDFAAGNLADHVGDSSTVQTNRRHLASALKAKEGLAFIRASHGADVAWVTISDTFADVDALVTDRNDIGLVALGADCDIIGLHGHRRDGKPVLGVAHCGWKGLVEDVIGSVAAEMTSAGQKASVRFLVLRSVVSATEWMPSGTRCERRAIVSRTTLVTG